MISQATLKNRRKFQILLIILFLVSIPLHVFIPQTSGFQKTVIIFQETRVFEWEKNNTAIYLDVEFWRIIFSEKGFEVVVKYIGQDNFNPKKVIRQYSEISTELYLVFNTHGNSKFLTYFLKLDRWRPASSIIHAIGNTRTCIVLASCYGELFVTRTLGGLGSNIECVAFSNRTSQSFYGADIYDTVNIFQTAYGPPFVNLLRSYSPYEAFQIMNRNETFHGIYWSSKTGLIK